MYGVYALTGDEAGDCFRDRCGREVVDESRMEVAEIVNRKRGPALSSSTTQVQHRSSTSHFITLQTSVSPYIPRVDPNQT